MVSTIETREGHMTPLERQAERAGCNTEPPSAEVIPMGANMTPANDAPIPLEGQPLPQSPYPIEALGPIMAPMAKSIVKNSQVSEPLAASCVLTTASLTAQQFADVKPPYISSNNKPCSLFLIVKAESGERKSAALNAALEPIRKYQKQLGELYDIDSPEYRSAIKSYEGLVKKARDKAKTTGEAKANIEAIGPEPKEPLSPTLIINEPTTEAFLKSAALSHAGRGIITDEAGAFLGGHSMSPEKRQHTITTLSKLWDAAPVTMLRVGRDTPPVKNKRLTMCLMGQGVVIDPLLSDPLAGGQGFLARFLTVSAPSRAGYRELRPRPTSEDYAASNIWNTTIFNIWASRTARMIDGTQNELNPNVLELDDQAYSIWAGFATAIEKHQAPEGKYCDIKPFASKAAEQALRLSGVMTVLEKPEQCQFIPADIMGRAVNLAQFYTDEHLRLIQEASAAPELSKASKLISWIKDNRGNLIYKADLTRSAPRIVRNDLAELETAINTLCDHRHIKAIPDTDIDGTKRKNCYEVLV